MIRQRQLNLANVREIDSTLLERYRSRSEVIKNIFPDLQELRVNALALLGDTLPLGKSERWRYTDLRRYFRKPADLEIENVEVSREDVERFFIADANRAVFIDGVLNQEFSDFCVGKGQPLDHQSVGKVADIKRNGFVALNTALFSDGVSIKVSKDEAFQKPLQILCLSSGGFNGETHSRITLTLEENSSATVLETYGALGPAQGLSDFVVELSLGRGASLDHIVIQRAADTMHHISTREGNIEAGASLNSFIYSEGGLVSRSEMNLSLAGEGAEAKISGVALVRGRQHCDITTDISHQRAHCHSNQIFKNVVDQAARAIFQGRVYVAPDAQRTDAHQMNRTLLLSRNASADAKPELVIHADDVKCSHGATVGELEEEALFYLRSRGVTVDDARSLLIKGFASELLMSIQNERIAALLEVFLDEWLTIKGEGGISL
ncbi:MAG: Fe-S cluster assembly protein SufD [Rhodospirillaceae bacterium]